MRKALILISWFPLTCTLLVLNLILLHSFQPAQASTPLTPLSATPSFNSTMHITASDRTSTAQILGAHVIAGDSRALLLSTFLAEHESPMAPYADHIVREADAHGIDFRLIAAIAMCESNLGKRMPSNDSFNAWGIAVYTGQQSGATFSDWPTAITWVSKYMKEKYYDKGLVDLKDIGKIYAPPSVNTGYSWTNCVESFQSSIY